jgi:class 3 adenylate cyclase
VTLPGRPPQTDATAPERGRNVAQPASADELNAVLNRGGLRFPDRIESAFREDYNIRWLGTNRAAFAGGILLVALFGVLDLWAAPDHLPAIWALRYGVCCVSTIALLLASARPGYVRWMQPAGSAVVIVVGIALVAMNTLISPREPGFGLYIFGVPIVIVFAYTAPRLRLPSATLAGTVLIAASIVAGIAHGDLRGDDAPVRFLVTTGIIAATNTIGMLAGYFIESGLRSNWLQHLILERERQRSDGLLLNILPAPVADRLKAGDVVVDEFESVSVLFADIVGFTPLSAGRSAEEIVNLLNEVFSRFDRLAESHGLEKIKTMGDAYLAVGGMPVPQPDHVERVAGMALDMQAEAAALSAGGIAPIRLRIGLHTGPVVAGVIGLRKFSYDLWGDTVNTASRMESQGKPGRIHVTEAIFECLAGRYLFDGPSLVDVKGKGVMRTYYLLARR